jgi:hypothetical protein
LLKKTLFLIAPLAPLVAVAAIATGPTPAFGDTICYGGVPSNPTRVCEVVCHVPYVIGRSLRKALHVIRAHDCSKGTVKRVGRVHKAGYHHLLKLVVKQHPKAGGFYTRGRAVNLKWRWKFQKNKG